MTERIRPLAACRIGVAAITVVALSMVMVWPAGAAFDHSYAVYGTLLSDHVVGTQVDYARLKRNRAALDAIVATFGQVTSAELSGWSRERQIAYWINAYNVFTLQAIVNHYPIQGSVFSLAPPNSIRQIDGVWTHLRWKTARGEMTLDQVEHETLRTQYEEPRIHFAINCASVSCPPLRGEPYRGEMLDRQLTLAARDFLASPHGVKVEGTTLHVTSLFDWYGDDFIPRYSSLTGAGRSERERAILGVIATYGPGAASRLAQQGTARIRYLDYDWSLNDIR